MLISFCLSLDIVSDELVDVAKEYEMLAKLNIVKEKDLAALKSELVGSGINEDIDVRVYVPKSTKTSFCHIKL
jgi:hypothetical protein